MTGRKQATRKRIGPPPPIKRKTVFLNYTQAELNAQYDQGIIGTDRMDYRQHWMDGTARARRLLETRLDIPYGRADVEKLDIYLPAKKSRKPAPVMIFFHGGAWRALTKDESAAYAPAYADAGAMIVVPDFGAAPETTLSQMVAQVRRAVAWTWKNIADYGGDPNRLIVAGHSSGAHMAGTTLADGWRKKAGLPENAIKGGVLFSGALRSHAGAPVRAQRLPQVVAGRGPPAERYERDTATGRAPRRRHRRGRPARFPPSGPGTRRRMEKGEKPGRIPRR